MIMAIMTSRRTKRANEKKFRKWRRRPKQNNYLERVSPLIATSDGVVVLSRTVVIIFLSLEVSETVNMTQRSCEKYI